MNSLVYSLLISLAMRMTVITVFIMLIKLALRRRLSAGAQCAIWAVPFIQCVFCLGDVSIPARTSIYNVVADITDGPVPAAVQSAPVDFRNVAVLIYIIGAAALFLWYIGVFLVHRVKVAASAPVTDHVPCRLLAEAKAGLGIADEIILKRGGYAHTLCNTVILPEGYSQEEQKQILLHELCHYRHKDNLKLWAAVFVICLNWFNPLVWFAFRRFRADIEMYCDDSVLKITDDRRAYARVLVKTASDHIRFIPGASSAANGTHEVARRVRRIVSWRKNKPVWLVVAMSACVCVSCLCLTDAVTAVVTNTVEIDATPAPAELVPAILDAVTAAEEAEPEVTEPPAAESAVRQPAAPVEVQKQQSTVVTQAPAMQNVQSVQPAVPETEPVVQETAVQETAEQEPIVQEPIVQEPETEPEPLPENESAALSGTRVSESANGSKEIYSLDDGRTAVLHYDDGNLETGYIISTEE